jgi:integrase
MTVLLSDCVDEWIAMRKVTYAKNTAKANEQALRRFLSVVGNLQMRHLGPEHGERYQSWMIAKGLAPNSVNNAMSSLAAFTSWCAARKYVSRGTTLTSTTRMLTAPVPPRLRIKARDFPRVLDACPRPDIRAMMALGFYLFLRAGEMRNLRVGDVDLDAGKVLVFQQKTQRYDEMPLCLELEQELRAWLTIYADDIRETAGPLRHTHYLIPAHRSTGWWDMEKMARRYQPDRPICQPTRFIHEVLEACGYPTRDANGKSNREGMHTLRRSGARAYYEEMVNSGAVRDDVLRQVMAMLHHKSVTVTERYLGLEADIEKRDIRLRGQRMFASNMPENVIQLERNVQ